MKKGFTLVELLISLVVIGILAGLGYKGYTVVTMNAKATQLLDQLGQIKAGMATYYKDMGTYPYNLAFLLRKPDSSSDSLGWDAYTRAVGDGTEDDPVLLEYWGGPYIEGMVEDPDNPGCIKAKTGGSICFGATINDNSTYGNEGLGLSAPTGVGNDVNPTIDPGTGSYVSVGSQQFYNVLSINRVQKDMAKKILTKANGESAPNTGNLLDVALGYSDESGTRVKNNMLIGVPSSNSYSRSNRIVFKYTKPY